MKRTALLTAALVGACVFVTDQSATLTVHNHSSHGLVDLRVAETHDSTWGPDLLPSTLWPGDDVTISDLSCGWYDAMITDEHGRTCVLSDMHLCVDDHDWVITDAALAGC